MAYQHKVYKGIVEGKSAHETVTEAVGTTLHHGSKTYQVMSDIWETGNYAVVWDGTRVKTVDWVENAVVDASDEVIAIAKEWTRTQAYLAKRRELLAKAEADAEALVRGCQAKVYKGRKFPVGTTGKVVGFAESQWGRSVGIATSDVTVEVVKNGKTYQNHKDVIWVAIGNVERVDIGPVDIAEIDERANEAAKNAVARGWWQS